MSTTDYLVLVGFIITIITLELSAAALMILARTTPTPFLRQTYRRIAIRVAVIGLIVFPVGLFGLLR